MRCLAGIHLAYRRRRNLELPIGVTRERLGRELSLTRRLQIQIRIVRTPLWTLGQS